MRACVLCLCGANTCSRSESQSANGGNKGWKRKNILFSDKTFAHMHYFDYFIRARGFPPPFFCFSFFALWLLMVVVVLLLLVVVVVVAVVAVAVDCHHLVSSRRHIVVCSLSSHIHYRTHSIFWLSLQNLKINDFPFWNWRQAISSAFCCWCRYCCI